MPDTAQRIHREPAESAPLARGGSRLDSWAPWIVVALLSIFAAQAIISMRQKNVTIDEITYVAAGSYHLATGDFDYNRTNPALMKMVVALPLLAVDVAMPERATPPSEWDAVEEWQYARRFLYENRVDADEMLFRARSAIVAMGVLLGGLVYFFASRLYGPRGGLLALFVYAFSPNMLAHTRLATQDLGLALVCFGGTLLCWHYARHPRPRTLIGMGVLLGLGAATKTTAVLLVPVWAIFWLASAWRDPQACIDRSLPAVARLADRNRPRAAQLASGALAICALAVIADLTLAAIYGFSGVLEPIGQALPAARVLARFEEGSLLRSLAATILALPSPLPAPFIEGLVFQRNLQATSGGLYFAGKIYPGGQWWVMGASLLLKIPLASIACVLVAAAGALRDRTRRDGEWLLLGLAGSFVLLFSLMSNIGGGVRYVLPALPCLFVVVGRFARPEARWTTPKQVALALLAVWYVGSSLWIHPHYLAYFNELIGGPSNGWRILAESNLDWGQDLKLLKRYMDERGIERIKLGYFGGGDARYYGIDYDYLPSVGLAPNHPGEYWWFEMDSDEKRRIEPPRGLVAVSANLVARPQWLARTFAGSYDWLEGVEPIDSVGYSILIYDFK